MNVHTPERSEAARTLVCILDTKQLTTMFSEAIRFIHNAHWTRHTPHHDTNAWADDATPMPEKQTPQNAFKTAILCRFSGKRATKLSFTTPNEMSPKWLTNYQNI